jgi:hypothetical protein
VDGPVTVDSEPWEKINTAGERANTELNPAAGDGVVLKPTQTSDLTATTMTAPGFWKDLSTLVPDWDYSMGLRMSIWNHDLNPGGNYDRCGVFLGSKVASNSDNGMVIKTDRGRMGTGNNGIESALFRNGASVSGYLYLDTTATYYTSKEEIILEVPMIGDGSFVRYCEAGSFPAIAEPEFIGYKYTDTNSAYNYKRKRPYGCGFYALRSNSATLLVAKIKAVKIEVRF